MIPKINLSKLEPVAAEPKPVNPQNALLMYSVRNPLPTVNPLQPVSSADNAGNQSQRGGQKVSFTMNTLRGLETNKGLKTFEENSKPTPRLSDPEPLQKEADKSSGEAKPMMPEVKPPEIKEPEVVKVELIPPKPPSIDLLKLPTVDTLKLPSKEGLKPPVTESLKPPMKPMDTLMMPRPLKPKGPEGPVKA